MKEQCNRYDRIDLADETKSLMRVIQSAGQIAHELEKDAAGGGLRTPGSLCPSGLCFRIDAHG